MAARPDNVWRVEIRWGNPYTEPPEGRPRVLAAARIAYSSAKGAPPRETWPAELHAALRDTTPGDGWAVCVGIDLAHAHANRVQWSTERKGRQRVANLRKRLERDCGPLFAGDVDKLLERELAQRPAYYQGEHQ